MIQNTPFACVYRIAPMLMAWMVIAADVSMAHASVPDSVPDTVRLLAPAMDDSLAPTSVVLQWEAAPGALRYDVQLSPTTAFTQRLDSNGITATRMNVRSLPAAQVIYWRVRAVDAQGAGPWCQPWRFNTYGGGSGGAGVPDSVKPLTELATGTYNGYQGGLYPNGANTPPAGHLAAGLSLAQQVVPLDTNGRPHPAGSIVLLSIGMSNCTQEYSRFKAIADTFAGKNPRVIIVDGAQGGQTASVIAVPTAGFWTEIENRLRTAGVRAQQVQAVWLKEANGGPTTGFPGYAQDLRDDLRTIVRSLPARYPNLKMVYLSSRIYAGYATTTLNPEMYAYESGFSVKWLIEQQIAGDTGLAYAPPARRAPWLAWGPYLWANGTHPRADGLIWEKGDLGGDGTHPSSAGQTKVAMMLLNFMATDTTTRGWFLRPAPSGVEHPAAAAAAMRVACQPNPAHQEMDITVDGATGPAIVQIFDVVGRLRLTLPAQPPAAVPGAVPGRTVLHCGPATIGDLPTGIYLVRASSAGGTATTLLRIVR